MEEIFTVKTSYTRELAETIRSAIVQLCTEAHQVDFGSLFSFLPPEGYHFLGYLGDQLVSHAVTTTRWLQPENLPLLETAYVDAVATLPSYQGQGFSSAVMRHLAEVNGTDYEVACLETEQVSFYQRLGWELWRGPLAGRGEEGLIPTPDQEGIMILHLPRTPVLNLDSLLTIEAQGRIW